MTPGRTQVQPQLPVMEARRQHFAAHDPSPERGDRQQREAEQLCVPFR